MVFSSVIFIFMFLPAVLALYFLAGKRYRNLLLTLFSLFFYFWGEGFLIWIILTSSLVDYASGLIISGAWKKGIVEKINPKAEKTLQQKIGLAFSLIVNLGLLAYFKYYNFGIDNFVWLFQQLGMNSEKLESIAKIALPLGISFYTFQSMSYTLDVYKGQLKATRNFLDFLCYVTLFPQLVAGPIVRYRDVEKELHTRTITLKDFAYGIERFCHGLLKKVLISNAIARVVDKVFSLGSSELYTSLAWAGAVGFVLQLYFDFSGYSDMAIGLGRMFGFHFKENFRWPYISKNLTEFWQRWHISLSSWIRDYVYAPIRNKNRHPSTAGIFKQQMFIFTLIGFWHGANWNFIIFGLITGFIIASERTWLKSFIAKAPIWIQRIYFFIIIIFLFTIFNIEDIRHIGVFFKTMIGIHHADSRIVPFFMVVRPDIIIAYLLGFLFVTPVFDKVKGWIMNRNPGLFLMNTIRIGYVLVLCFLLILAIGQISSGTYNPFIYFRF